MHFNLQKSIQETAKATDDLKGNKIADEITCIPKYLKSTAVEIPKGLEFKN